MKKNRKCLAEHLRVTVKCSSRRGGDHAIHNIKSYYNIVVMFCQVEDTKAVNKLYED